MDDISHDERTPIRPAATAGQGGLNRREFMRLAGGIAGSLALPTLLEACGSAASAPSASGSTSAGGASAAVKASSSAYPNYIPTSGGAKPDYPASGADTEDGFDTYPANPVSAFKGDPPGLGSTVNILTLAYSPAPTPLASNPAWQAMNKALNANIQIQLASQADYQLKLGTVMAGNDLPDILFLNAPAGSASALAAAPGTPQFLQSQAADLTPYLSGDGAKDYPYLAATPTVTWKNIGAVSQGHLYLVPVPRPAMGPVWVKNSEIYDKEIGKDYVPKSADDFKRILLALNRPKDDFYGIAGAQGTMMWVNNFSAAFGGPNGWRPESDGKLTRAWETPEFKETTGWIRDLWAAGVFHPDSVSYASSVVGRNQFSAGKFAIYSGDTPAAWRDAWRDALRGNKPFTMHALGLFPAHEGGKHGHFVTGGHLWGSAIKKAAPERVKELLRIMNWFAAPFGSAEDLLLTYGVKDADFTLDAKGNPAITKQGGADVNNAPWSRVAQHPWTWFAPDIDGFAKYMTTFEKAIVPFYVKDPTFGLFSATAFTKGSVADKAVADGITDIVVGRRPLSDYDQIVKDWQAAGGEQIRREFMDAVKAAS